ncbi:hypothetical protein EDB89DRAFT_2072290 [Lactarius sanguifluus]|nr:hypothetical protein EDB89DRAFT_2072290 [Lactarius sanguifluus]
MQFIVVLGRLSFAELPDEVSVQDRGWLEQLVDLACDVMDLVMAGLESESVWSLFQEDRDEEGQESTGGSSEAGTAEGEGDIVMQVDIGMLYDDDDSQLEFIADALYLIIINFIIVIALVSHALHIALAVAYGILKMFEHMQQQQTGN